MDLLENQFLSNMKYNFLKKHNIKFLDSDLNPTKTVTARK